MIKTSYKIAYNLLNVKVDRFFENAASNLGPSVKIEDRVGFKWVTVKGFKCKAKTLLVLSSYAS